MVISTILGLFLKNKPGEQPDASIPANPAVRRAARLTKSLLDSSEWGISNVKCVVLDPELFILIENFQPSYNNNYYAIICHLST